MSHHHKKASSTSGTKRGPKDNGRRLQDDSSISNSRGGKGGTLKAWEPDSDDGADLRLENPSDSVLWDQFAANEHLFSLQTDYDETIYTTAIDLSHPQDKHRLAEAKRKARERRKTKLMTSRGAEESVLDNADSKENGGHEHHKYSAITLKNLLPGHGKSVTKYGPSGLRAPGGQSPSYAGPVYGPMMSNVVESQGEKAGEKKSEHSAKSKVPAASEKHPAPMPVSGKLSRKMESRPEATKPGHGAMVGYKTRTLVRPTRSASFPTEPVGGTASTVERDVLNSFKSFSTKRRLSVSQLGGNKANHFNEANPIELKDFARNVKLSTSVPHDPMGNITKYLVSQQDIQPKTLQDAGDLVKGKTDRIHEHGIAREEGPSNPVTRKQKTPAAVQSETLMKSRPAPDLTCGGDSSGGTATGDQPKNSQRVTPGRYSANFLRSSESGIHEYRTPFLGARVKPSVRPNHCGSINQMGHVDSSQLPAGAANGGQLVRRKVQAVDPGKFHILNHVKTIKPTPPKNWDENDPLRLSWDTHPSWRQVRDDQTPDSTMRLNYQEYFEKHPFSGTSMPTPNPQHSVPRTHQSQLPHHLKQGHGIPPSQTPRKPLIQMHTGQHSREGVPFALGNNRYRHRKVRASSAQPSQATGRPHPMVSSPAMNSAAQMPHNQPTMQAVMSGSGARQMNNTYRNLENGQYGVVAQHHMVPSMMMQPPFVTGPQGMSQMLMYPSGYPPHLVPTAGTPYQPMPGCNAYPGLGWPAVPTMAPQYPQYNRAIRCMNQGTGYQQPTGPPMGPYGLPGQPYIGSAMMAQPPFVAGPRGMPQMQTCAGYHPGHFMPPSGAHPQPMASPMMAPPGCHQGTPMYPMGHGMQYQAPAFPQQEPEQYGGRYSNNGTPNQQQNRRY